MAFSSQSGQEISLEPRFYLFIYICRALNAASVRQVNTLNTANVKQVNTLRNESQSCWSAISILYVVIIVFQIFWYETCQGEERGSIKEAFQDSPLRQQRKQGWSISGTYTDNGTNCCSLHGNENETVFRLHVVTNKLGVAKSGLLQEGEFNESLCLTGGSCAGDPAAQKPSMGKVSFCRNPAKSYCLGLENSLKTDNWCISIKGSRKNMQEVKLPLDLNIFGNNFFQILNLHMESLRGRGKKIKNKTMPKLQMFAPKFILRF